MTILRYQILDVKKFKMKIFRKEKLQYENKDTKKLRYKKIKIWKIKEKNSYIIIRLTITKMTWKELNACDFDETADKTTTTTKALLRRLRFAEAAQP